MDLSRVKTYLILVLLAANILLVSLFGWRYFSESKIKRQSELQLVELLSSKGINISELPPETSPTMLLQRDLKSEFAAATAILGTTKSENLGGVYRYSNSKGEAVFRSGGRFSITLYNGNIYSGDFKTTCIELLISMGFYNYTDDFIDETYSSDGFILSFGQTIDNKTLYNGQVNFSFSDDGRLLSIYGLWTFGSLQAISESCKSAGAILLIFSENNDADIVSMELGYRLWTYTSDSARIVPEWKIICKNYEYFLDAFTGIEVKE